MTIAAIQPDFLDMLRMAEGHRLDRRIADPGVLRGHVIIDPRRGNATQHRQIDDDLERQLVRRLREKFRHGREIIRRTRRSSDVAARHGPAIVADLNCRWRRLRCHERGRDPGATRSGRAEPREHAHGSNHPEQLGEEFFSR